MHKLVKAKAQVKLSDLVISAEVDQLKSFRINENKLVTADLSINFLKNKFELFSEMCEWFLKQNWRKQNSWQSGNITALLESIATRRERESAKWLQKIYKWNLFEMAKQMRVVSRSQFLNVQSSW